jgi:hypothetical protein
MNTTQENTLHKSVNPIQIVQYKWSGSWGPFKISIPCGECSVTEGIIKHVLEEDFKPEFEKGLLKFEVRMASELVARLS